MRVNRSFLVAVCAFCIWNSVSYLSAQESQQPQGSDQQINDFSIAGYGERGKKSWDIAGKSADVYTDNVKLKDITGNLYGEKEDVKLKAQKGDFNKAEGKVHLEKDVVITTSSGAKLTTDSLDWDRKNNKVLTKDKVQIEKDNMITQATGAVGQAALHKVDLEKDVKVEIKPSQTDAGGPAAGQEKITITSDGPLSIDYEKNIATFNDNVKVDRGDTQIFSDKMDIYFNTDSQAESSKKANTMNSKVEKIIARGNVKIVNGQNVSYSEEATYSVKDKKVILSGKPKLVIYSTEGMNASFGDQGPH